MILVQNHQQRLNGNNLILLFCLCVMMISCSSSTKLIKPSPRSDNPTGKDHSSSKTSIDTVEWTEVSEIVDPPIVSEIDDIEDEFSSERKNRYSMALFLPLRANRSQVQQDAIQEGTYTNRYLSYYAGMKMALEDLESKGLRMTLEVYDSERNQDKVQQDLRNRRGDTDVIIGPYSKAGLSVAAEYGRRNRVLVVNPRLAISSITKNNPYYLQLTPSLEDHYVKMIDHAITNFDQDQIMLVQRDQSVDAKMKKDDISRIHLLQDLYAAQTRENYNPFEVAQIHKDSLMAAESVFDNVFIDSKPKVFILPYWKKSDDDFVYNFLRKLNGEKGLNQVYVYCMPRILDSEDVDFNLYRNLNIRVCTNSFTNHQNSKVKELQQRFFKKYNALPNDNIIEGYDIMNFVGSNLLEYGKNFQFELDDKQEYLQSTYFIQEKYEKLDPGDDRHRTFMYYVNKQLDVIVFRDSNFEKI